MLSIKLYLSLVAILSINLCSGQSSPQSLIGCVGETYALDFSRDGKYLAAGGSDSKLRVWDTKSGALLVELTNGTSINYSFVKFSSDGKYITAAGNGDVINIQLWDVENGRLISNKFYYEKICDDLSLTMSSDQKYLSCSVIGGANSALWKSESNGLNGFIGIDGGTKVAFSTDSKFLLTARRNLVEAYLYDINGKLVRTFFKEKEIARNLISALVFSFDSKMIATGGRGNTIHVWDVETGELLKEYQKVVSPILYLFHSHQIVTTSSQEVVTIL